MAADGVFLPRLAVLHPRYRTPALAIVAESAWAIVLTLTGTFAQLVDYVSFGDWIFFGLTVAGLYRLRARDGAAARGPARPGGLRVPGYPWTPAIFVLAAILVVASSIRANPRNAAIGTGLLLLGVPVYLWWRRPPAAAANRGAGEPRDARGVIVPAVMLASPAQGTAARAVARRQRSASRCSATRAHRTPGARHSGSTASSSPSVGSAVQVEGGGLYGDVDLTEPHTLRLTLYDSLPGRPVADPSARPAASPGR